MVRGHEASDSNIKVCRVNQNDDGTYCYGLLNTSRFYNGETCLIYRKKQHNKIIFEEIKTDYPVFGEFYLREEGSVVRWNSYDKPLAKFRIFKLTKWIEKCRCSERIDY